MSNILKYKGYTGSIETSIEDGEILLYGKILFIRDTILYEADRASELKAAFESAVDDYLETCVEVGKPADTPHSGSFNVRIGPELHRKAAIHAHLNGITLNAVMVKAVEQLISDEQTVRHDHKVTHTIKIERELSLDALPQGEQIWETALTRSRAYN